MMKEWFAASQDGHTSHEENAAIAEARAV
jgi:hypothetical protein